MTAISVESNLPAPRRKAGGGPAATGDGTATGLLEVPLTVRMRGVWRLRLVIRLLSIGIYIPGSWAWALRARPQFRIREGKWRPMDTLADMGVEVKVW